MKLDMIESFDDRGYKVIVQLLNIA